MLVVHERFVRLHFPGPRSSGGALFSTAGRTGVVSRAFVHNLQIQSEKNKRSRGATRARTTLSKGLDTEHPRGRRRGATTDTR